MTLVRRISRHDLRRIFSVLLLLVLPNNRYPEFQIFSSFVRDNVADFLRKRLPYLVYSQRYRRSCRSRKVVEVGPFEGNAKKLSDGMDAVLYGQIRRNRYFELICSTNV